MSTPYKNTPMSGDVVWYQNMNSIERRKIAEEIKRDWMSHHNKQSCQSFPIIPSILQMDFDVILASVKYHGLELSMASPELRGNSEIVMAAVKRNGCSLKDSSMELRCNKDIVMVAVKK